MKKVSRLRGDRAEASWAKKVQEIALALERKIKKNKTLLEKMRQRFNTGELSAEIINFFTSENYN